MLNYLTSKHKVINKITAHWVWNTYSHENFTRENEAKRFSLDFMKCELTVPQVEHLLASIIKTYYKLQELGFTYHNGKIVVVYIEEMENDVK